MFWGYGRLCFWGVSLLVLGFGFWSVYFGCRLCRFAFCWFWLGCGVWLSFFVRFLRSCLLGYCDVRRYGMPGVVGFR